MTARQNTQASWYALTLLLPVGLLAGLRADRATFDFWLYPFQLLVAAGALAYCARQAFRSDWPRPLLLALTAGLALWTLATLTVVIHVNLMHWYVVSTRYTYLLFVSWGIPLLYVAVSHGDPYASRSQQVLDAVLLTLLGVLYALSIQDVLDVNGDIRPGRERYVLYAFDAESVFLAAAHAFRWLTSRPGPTRRFFGITSLFLGAYTLCIGMHNHFLAEQDPGWLSDLGDALPPVPFLALVLMLHRYRGAQEHEEAATGFTQRLAMGASPILFLAAIFALGYSVDARHSLAGMIVAGLALLVYAARILRTQYGYMKAQQELQTMARALERLSYTDPVTGIPNRRAFDEAFAREWAQCGRERLDLSVLMIDVDRFKGYNDRHGHHAGDQCLRAIARLVAGSLRRPADFCGRFGGEEFVILLPGTAEEGALVVARRILATLEAASLPHDGGIDGRVTVSAGIAVRMATDLRPPQLLERADRNLYRAKEQGRNRFEAGELRQRRPAARGTLTA